MDGFKNTTKTSYDTASGRKFANGGSEYGQFYGGCDAIWQF